VEIVVVRDVIVRILFLGGAERALGKAAEFRSSKDGVGRSGQFEKTATGHGRGASDAQGAEELPPIEVDRLRGNIRVRQIGGFANQTLLLRTNVDGVAFLLF